MALGMSVHGIQVFIHIPNRIYTSVHLRPSLMDHSSMFKHFLLYMNPAYV